MKRTIRIACTLALIGALVVLGGCGVVPTKKAAGPKLATTSAKVSGTLPENFPTELYLWEGATVTKANHVDKGNFDVYEVELTTTDTFAKVKYGFATALKNGGWNPQELASDASTSMISGSKGTVEAAYTLTKQDDGTVKIALSAQVK